MTGVSGSSRCIADVRAHETDVGSSTSSTPSASPMSCGASQLK